MYVNIHIGVAEEIVRQKEFWKEKQKEIQGQFKDIYKPPPKTLREERGSSNQTARS